MNALKILYSNGIHVSKDVLLEASKFIPEIYDLIKDSSIGMRVENLKNKAKKAKKEFQKGVTKLKTKVQEKRISKKIKPVRKSKDR